MDSLKILIFMGSARTAAPFWNPESKPGMPGARVCDRVVEFVKKSLGKLDKGPKLEVLGVVDPSKSGILQSLATNNGNPTYYHSADKAKWGKELVELHTLVTNADAFIIVTPEYNHTIPPALTLVMNQIGCSVYANKVSGCVCYSGTSSAAGGGRVAVALRPFLSELGCLPVSKQVLIPNASVQISEAGEPQGDHATGMGKTMAAMLGQLQWWAEACKRQRSKKI